MGGEEQRCGCAVHWEGPLSLLLASAELGNAFTLTMHRRKGEGVALK